MKAGAVWVWLPADVRLWLEEYRRGCGGSVSGVVRECVLAQLRGLSVDERVRRVLLERELDELSRESRRLRGVQNSILSNFVYLQDYAEELVKGAFKSPAFTQLRKSVLRYPNGEKALQALEHLFSRRQEIGARQCEVARLLYPENKYGELGRLKTEYHEEHTMRMRRVQVMHDTKLEGR